MTVLLRLWNLILIVILLWNASSLIPLCLLGRESALLTIITSLVLLGCVIIPHKVHLRLFEAMLRVHVFFENV
jgi:hypothetical protein